MKNPHLKALPPFDTRGGLEKRYLLNTLKQPFSGYLGGIHRGGYWIERLRHEWASTFKCKGAVPCNSATSGLLAACMAAGIGPGDVVWCPVYTMSATAACAKVLGAKVEFMDIEEDYFSIFNLPKDHKPKAIIVTNLFGHPPYLDTLRWWCDENRIVMIEDNAQAPFAMQGDKYTGTIGHIGVFSLNIHKHMQTGEGGVVVTNDPYYLLRVEDAINHGELRDFGAAGIMGLNLRMTEPIAALACAQLSKGWNNTENRRQLALEMTEMVKDIPWVIPPQEGYGCRHVYYLWAARVPKMKRGKFLHGLNSRGLPMRSGYSPLLSQIFKVKGEFPVADRMEHEELITFEICSHDPTGRQRKIMKEIFHATADECK